MTTADDTSVEQLQRRAENALRSSRSPREVERLLVQLLARAPEDGEHALFAHRHLAELRLEREPWRAALHLRRVIQRKPHDDVVHALMGLAQALLGNYRSAVSAYRRALQIAPRNPWYHHNLGHLLDVAMGRPEQAVDHLSSANRMEPDQHEIAASLAHCLGRLGRLAEALELARSAVRMDPRNKDHRALLSWIEDGAENTTPAAGARRRGGKRRPADAEAVVRVLTREMRQAGFSARQVQSARALWDDFRESRRIRVIRPEIYAAAVEYAIALIHRIDGVTQTDVARRYGVARKTLARRYGEIRDGLALRRGDPRYG